MRNKLLYLNTLKTEYLSTYVNNEPQILVINVIMNQNLWFIINVS